MPTRKQRRRRTKGLRHEYEYVYVDDAGQEVEAPPEPERGPTEREATRGRQSSRAARKIEPPSLRRVGRRALLLGPVMYLTVHFLVADLSTQEELLQTLFLLAIFLPMSYAMDALMYRFAAKRGQAAPRKPA